MNGLRERILYFRQLAIGAIRSVLMIASGCRVYVATQIASMFQYAAPFLVPLRSKPLSKIFLTVGVAALSGYALWLLMKKLWGIRARFRFKFKSLYTLDNPEMFGSKSSDSDSDSDSVELENRVEPPQEAFVLPPLRETYIPIFDTQVSEGVTQERAVRNSTRAQRVFYKEASGYH